MEQLECFSNPSLTEARAFENTAPLTEGGLDSLILGADYHRFPGTEVTVCCLFLSNGCTVTGESACTDPARFDAEKGRAAAFAAAKARLWELEGYARKRQDVRR